MGHDIKDMDGYRAMLLSNPPGFFREMAHGPFFNFNRPNAKVDQAWIDEWLHMSMQTGLKAAHDTTFAWHQYYGDEMAAIDRPVLLLQGDDDQIVDIKMSSLESIKILKQGTLKIYPGGPHAIPNLNADEVNHDIENFIKTGKV
jgi:non-heme chloroperoxidase